MVLIYENKEKENQEKPKVIPEAVLNSTPAKEITKDSIESESQLSPYIVKLLEKYKKELLLAKRDYTPIHVDEIASRVSKFYEKIRKVVDWKDDNALRRNAIERVLKRVLFAKVAGITIEKVKTEKLAKIITLDLIRGGHLPNDTVPSEKIEDVSTSLKKYMVFLEHANSYKAFEVKEKLNYTNFILEIASCELEEILTNPVKEYGLIDTMTEIISDRTSILSDDNLGEDYRERHVFIAVCRVLYNFDDNFIIYRLLEKYNKNWKFLSDSEVDAISKDLPNLWKSMTLEINLPITRKLVRICRKVDTVFILLDDILEKLKNKPKELIPLFQDREKFATLVREKYDERYTTLKTRLFRLAMFSTLSVFLSNWFTFYIIEVPLAKLFYEKFSWTAAAIDFLIPTILMFLMVAFIRPPEKENEDRVINSVMGFVYDDEKKEKYQVSIVDRKMSLFKMFLLALYIETIFVVFAALAYIFYISGLPITSVIFDTFTIALTVFAAVGIKNKSLELNVDEQTNIKDFVFDTFSIPIAKVGSVLAKKWKEYNIVAIFFNFVIETPFTIILDFIQGWSEYIKERREEIS